MNNVRRDCSIVQSYTSLGLQAARQQAEKKHQGKRRFVKAVKGRRNLLGKNSSIVKKHQRICFCVCKREVRQRKSGIVG
jgi:hypothetical protein